MQRGVRFTELTQNPLFFEFRLQAFQCLFDNRTAQLFLLCLREVRIANRIDDFLAAKYPGGTHHLSDRGDRTDMDRGNTNSFYLFCER